jgi:hypothetical protein
MGGGGEGAWCFTNKAWQFSFPEKELSVSVAQAGRQRTVTQHYRLILPITKYGIEDET